MRLKEIAGRIDAHLKRFEADPVINATRDGTPGGLTPYWHAGAAAYGRHVSIVYVSYQGRRALSRIEAEKYLAWLDSGEIGKYFKSTLAPTPTPEDKPE